MPHSRIRHGMPQPVKFNPNSETEKGARPPRALFSAPRGKPWIVQKSSRPAGWMTSCEVRDARRVPLRPWRACSPTSEFGLNLISTRTGSWLSCMPIRMPGHKRQFCGIMIGQTKPRRPGSAGVSPACFAAKPFPIHSPPGRQRSQDGDRTIAEYAREIWNAEPFLTE